MTRQHEVMIEAYWAHKHPSLTEAILDLAKDRHDFYNVERCLLNQPQHVYFARHKKRIIGFATALLEDDAEEAALSLQVQHHYRRQGIGSRLFLRTVSGIRMTGHDPNFISFYQSEDRASAAFYHKHGMPYRYSDLSMYYDKQKHKLLRPAPPATIVRYSDRYYEPMIRLRNLGIREDQKLKGLPIRPIFSPVDRAYRVWMDSQQSNSFVLLDEDLQMIGFSMAAVDGEVRSVVVDPAHRGHGYATALTSKALSRQIQTGRDPIYLFVTQQNMVARHIYEKLGFTIGERYDAAFGKPPYRDDA